MELTTYQRSKFNKYIAPLVKRECCEICSCTSDLEVHHEKLFVETLYETLEELNLAYRDTSEYLDMELELITNVMAGKQIRQDYSTLCNKCHHDLHTEQSDVFKAACKNKYYLNKYGVTSFEYIDGKIKLINSSLKKWFLEKKQFPTLKDREQIIVLLDIRRNGKQLKSLDSVNEYLGLINCKYRILEINKQVNGIRYQHMWIVEEL